MADRTDGVSRRAQIIDLAAELFEQHGYHETSMEVLARRVGVKKASLYYYFSNKDLILVEIHEQMIDYLLDRARARSGTPTERLWAVMYDLVSLMELFPGRLRTFFEHYRELPADQRRVITAKRDAYHGVLVSILREGDSTGEFQIEDIQLTSLSILGMCNWAYQWFKPGGPLTAEQIANQFLKMTLSGIGAQMKAEPTPAKATQSPRKR